MSTRTGVVLPDELYRKYKEILFKEQKTVQADLLQYVKAKCEKVTKGNNEQ